MGFETTPLPLPPPSAAFKANVPDINLTKGNLDVMEIDDEYGVEDFAAEIAAISSGSEDECEFYGFCRSAHAAKNIEEEGKEGKESEEEDGPLYRMEALTSEADALMTFPSKSLDAFLLSEEPSEDLDNPEDDHKDTPITRKVAVKGKGKVVEKGRQVKTGKDLRKTKGALLWEMITTACDQPNSGNADGLPCGPEGVVGLYVYSCFGLSPWPPY